MRYIFLIVFAFISRIAMAQILILTGQVIDSSNNIPIPGAVVHLKNNTSNHIVSAGSNGQFTISGLKKGVYSLEISYLSYKKFETQISIVSENLNLERIRLQMEDLNIQQVDILGHITPVSQNGDTTEMSAKAYKVNPDADALDLVRKMPGITIQNGIVKAQGEEIKKVMLDGKDYYGSDVTLSLQNIASEMIDKVQIYNKLSDQSEFIGFDDGQSQKVMNIVTRNDRKVGQNGKLTVGYGPDNKYLVNGRWNGSNKKNNFSLTGGSNNVSQQNFSMQDMFQGMGNGGPVGGERPIFIGRMSGINAIHSLGANYSGDITNKFKLTTSYFYNNQDNSTVKHSDRAQLGAIDTLFQARYENQDDNTTKTNGNHRLNAFLEYKIDSLSTLTYRQTLSIQQTDQNTLIDLIKYNDISNPLLESLSQTLNNANGYSYSGNLVFRHKFMKKGRTFSLGTQFFSQDQNIDNTSLSNTATIIENLSINQVNVSNVIGKTFSANLMYTEPISKYLLLMASYNTSFNPNNTEKLVYDNGVDPAILLDSISNKYESKFIAQRGGISLLIQKDKKLNASVGLEFQNSELSGSRYYPDKTSLSKIYKNILPNLMLNYKISKSSNLMTAYRTSTTAPSITQLQNIIDISNSTTFYLGNPNLNPAYTHMFFSNIRISNPAKFTNIGFNLFGNYSVDPIGNETQLMSKDTVIYGQTLLQNGQLINLVNLPDSWNVRSFVNYGFLFKPIKCNINFSAGAGYSTTPGIVNHVSSETKSLDITDGIVIASNISQYIDFTVSYNGNCTISRNDIAVNLNSNIWRHIIGLTSTLTSKIGLVLTNSLSEQIITGYSGDYDQNYLVWNATLGIKIFKNKRGQFSILINDILDQNKDISRTVSDYYVADNNTNTMGRYGMVTFTYTFKSYVAKSNSNSRFDLDGNPPIGMPPGGQLPNPGMNN